MHPPVPHYEMDDNDQIIEADDYLMRASGIVLAHGFDMAISENRATSDPEQFDAVEYERITGQLGRRDTDSM